MKINGVVTSIFPDNINTDDIIPAWTLQESTERMFFKKYAFQNYDTDFVKRSCKAEKSIVVAGTNFGCGSSREQAVYALTENNVVAVIAKSYPDIFYRNALNNGLLLITLNDVSIFKKNQSITVDLENKKITVGKKIIAFKMNEEDALIFSQGGKITRVKKHLQTLLTSPNRPKSLLPAEALAKVGQPQTMVEKIVSSHLDKAVFQGEKIERLPIDVLFFNEVIGPAAIKDFYSYFQNTAKVFDPKKVFLIPDHTVPSASVAVSEGITLMEQFAKEQGIRCYKEGDGIEHVVLAEDGYIVPGSIILGTDSHTDTNGAFNTLSFGIGTTDGAFALATGHLYDFEIPKTIRVNLTGKLPKMVYGKDIILYLIGKLGVAGASKKIVEFGGPGLKSLSMDARATIANMVVEMGARTAIFEFDEVLSSYLHNIPNHPDFLNFPYLPDDNCLYDQTVEIDLSTLEPCVAFPHKPDNVTFVSRVKTYLKKSQKSKRADIGKVDSLKITDAFLGACTNGRYEDFVEAAKILKGKKIHPEVNFVAIPASRKIYNKLLKNGVLQIFAQAGANIESANCGPCFGKHMGIVDKAARVISTSNRNYIGRMGAKEAYIFLASPATVAASAVAGEITDPRNYLKDIRI